MPSLGISVGGEVIDVPDRVALALIETHPVVGREWRRARAKFGPRGRVILIEPEVVAQVRGLVRASGN